MLHDKEPGAHIKELLRIMTALRTPETGCPWDLAQTFKTIAPYTIEEAYEVADAIELGDMDGLKEELGDLQLQVVYHARMAEEAGAFEFADVVAGIIEKMVRRHPHVFGTPAERAAGALPGFWEQAKMRERAATGATQSKRPSTLDGVPTALPALTRAVKLQNKAARVGFDWPSLEPVFAKLKEELGELEHAVAADRSAGKAEEIEEEFGDLLFVVANVARHLRLDPEAALRSANQKFVRRFQAVEKKLAAEGRTPVQSNLEEMDKLWDETKVDEKAEGSAKDR
jgi:MazG family protein